MGRPVERDAATLRRGQDKSTEERNIRYLAINVLSQVTIDLFAVQYLTNSVTSPSLLATGSPALREDWRRLALGRRL